MNTKIIVFLALVAVALCNPVDDQLEGGGKDKRSLFGLGLGLGLGNTLAAPFAYNPYYYPYAGPFPYRAYPYGPYGPYARTTIYG
ncbi:Hypothetical predicted protein [Cloeon dipterum]|uniref:Sulfur globule protein CV3 n=1 Tax=Cloeon dipterum TaxID=197152 RepID=A0A8S1C7C2_9INSE|nr:Hypothetical predicted protein [Cloeon dipterum]